LAFVLAPTRELAKQVDKESSPGCYGGLPIMSQINLLGKGLDIVVGTPGCIFFYIINRGAPILSEVQFIVLDEADQILKMSFDEDVAEKTSEYVFSATMHVWVQRLFRKYLNVSF
jgi:superfamily II DNA/RNA helicase